MTNDRLNATLAAELGKAGPPGWSWSAWCHGWAKGPPEGCWRVAHLLAAEGPVAEAWYQRWGKAVAGTRKRHPTTLEAMEWADAQPTPGDEPEATREPPSWTVSGDPVGHLRWAAWQAAYGGLSPEAAYRVLVRALDAQGGRHGA